MNTLPCCDLVLCLDSAWRQNYTEYYRWWDKRGAETLLVPALYRSSECRLSASFLPWFFPHPPLSSCIWRHNNDAEVTEAHYLDRKLNNIAEFDFWRPCLRRKIGIGPICWDLWLLFKFQMLLRPSRAANLCFVIVLSPGAGSYFVCGSRRCDMLGWSMKFMPAGALFLDLYFYSYQMHQPKAMEV